MQQKIMFFCARHDPPAAAPREDHRDHHGRGGGRRQEARGPPRRDEVQGDQGPGGREDLHVLGPADCRQDGLCSAPQVRAPPLGPTLLCPVFFFYQRNFSRDSRSDFL